MDDRDASPADGIGHEHADALHFRGDYSPTSMPTHGGPPEPVSFEDFEYPAASYDGFEYDPFPSTSGTSGSASSAAFFASSNPFSPSGFSPAYPSSGYTPPPSMHTPPPAASEDPPPPLFDPSESANFANFLTNLDGESHTFLFDPVLPPGMPSPPSAPLRREERNERETLGAEVDNLRLGGSPGVVKVEPDDDDEDEYPDDDRERAGVKTRGAAGGHAGRGTGKKVKVDDSNSDVDMPHARPGSDDDSITMTSKPRRPPRSARPPARRPSTARVPLAPPAPAPIASTSVLDPSPSPSASASDPDQYPTSSDKKTPLTDSQKRSNHILSEQKRRNAIRSGFKDLVDLLAAGETASGIVVAPPEVEMEAEDKGRKKKLKSSGRGRGRKGDAGAGASKSVVLEKAASYIRWLERGNEGLEAEVKRVESLLERGGEDTR